MMVALKRTNCKAGRGGHGKRRSRPLRHDRDGDTDHNQGSRRHDQDDKVSERGQWHSTPSSSSTITYDELKRMDQPKTWKEENDRMRAALQAIWDICHAPSKGQYAYTHFMRDFDQVRALCKPFVDARRPSSDA
jgi:hypothetical protein